MNMVSFVGPRLGTKLQPANLESSAGELPMFGILVNAKCTASPNDQPPTPPPLSPPKFQCYLVVEGLLASIVQNVIESRRVVLLAEEAVDLSPGSSCHLDSKHFSGMCIGRYGFFQNQARSSQAVRKLQMTFPFPFLQVADDLSLPSPSSFLKDSSEGIIVFSTDLACCGAQYQGTNPLRSPQQQHTPLPCSD